MQWRSVLEKSNESKAAWHVDKVLRVVDHLRRERQSLASALRASSTIRKCAELSDAKSRGRLIHHPDFLGCIYFFLSLGSSSDVSPGVSTPSHERNDPHHLSTLRVFARIHEHALMTVMFALVEMVLDEGFACHLVTSLRSELVVVVSAAAQLIRRISELPGVCNMLGFDVAVFHEMLNLLEHVHDPRVSVHVLCAIVNMSAVSSLQFMLARCHRLVSWLTDTVFAWLRIVNIERRVDDQGDIVVLPQSEESQLLVHEENRGTPSVLYVDVVRSCRALANLCSNSENRHAVRESTPNIFEAMLGCCEAAETFNVGLQLTDLADAARRVIHLLHDDPAQLHAAISSELIRTASPLRAALTKSLQS
eukprot:CAMPEP_0176406796 /NCGR_PEP_ID=MMETSP0127-20121128/1067_1 /TAXON_ID=938130 /ORGANISM="Platyophrya macrostoma, Strain WH" /LENGTH=363 /DNA_ID=CAMNT_0017785955 /DNA_START=128 /DNA_END=1220 /DNA_ORIENTATION=+